MGALLIVDDDENIRNLIKLVLQKQGYNTITANDGMDALDKFDEENIDLLITDVMMPRMDGWELCKEIRNVSNLPILILTVQSDTAYKIKGFELGIDDYLTKPFEPAELSVRVKALLRRYKINTNHIITIGNLTIDKDKFEIRAKNECFTLPLKEFEILFLLASSIGKIFTREYLIETIWGYDFEGNERTLDVHIGRLRERFQGEKYNIKIITIRGLGYKLEDFYAAKK
ncbi:response regulator transcription factor [Anaeromicropila populeti]|uniref:Heme response regulator HssR n=1 Tax=Anaeromicropila populeti TaxID=37658 RepID=A0A1I6HNL4_9FIRM|nr:response regulator transcription factor [Anaeromicropila populeti]SFR56042.1 DNA-binding response regulator, OmpR family, contains REC and winged-helix (wHTH) domain [Anaeromicropila populeti]